MQEQCQKLSNIDKIYVLCEEIIRSRKFESLVDLNEQCIYLTNKMQEQINNPLTCESPLTKEEEAVFLLLYYIYYILLDDKERNIFTELQRLIFIKNVLIYSIYKEFNLDNDRFRSQVIEEQKCLQYAVSILFTYTGIEDNKDQINFDKINEFIYFIIDNNYDAISNDYYLIYMLAIGTLDYKKVLSRFSYDALMQRFINVANVIINKFNNDSLADCEMNESTDQIEREMDEIRF